MLVTAAESLIGPMQFLGEGVAATSPPYPTLGGQPPRSTRPEDPQIGLTPRTPDALSPVERGGTPLLRTWERGAIHFRWSSDRILTQGFLDRDDRPHVPLTGLGAN